ncbi:hypothetical protein GOV06_04470 [Candidatus Woesearchaeota archaeon]|nr:hypothetical protein [Candidatus Woesearchaeota archaeon]
MTQAAIEDITLEKILDGTVKIEDIPEEVLNGCWYNREYCTEELCEYDKKTPGRMDGSSSVREMLMKLVEKKQRYEEKTCGRFFEECESIGKCDSHDKECPDFESIKDMTRKYGMKNYYTKKFINSLKKC